MLCDELILLYRNHIEPNLIGDELFYSPLVEMKFLDLWKKLTITFVPKYSSVRSYHIHHNRNADIFECYYRNGETLMIGLYLINHAIVVDHVYTDFDYLLLNGGNIDSTDLVIDLIKKHKLDIELYDRYINNVL
jgi:hypothetical protein